MAALAHLVTIRNEKGTRRSLEVSCAVKLGFPSFELLLENVSRHIVVEEHSEKPPLSFGEEAVETGKRFAVGHDDLLVCSGGVHSTYLDHTSTCSGVNSLFRRVSNQL